MLLPRDSQIFCTTSCSTRTYRLYQVVLTSSPRSSYDVDMATQEEVTFLSAHLSLTMTLSAVEKSYVKISTKITARQPDRCTVTSTGCFIIIIILTLYHRSSLVVVGFRCVLSIAE